MTSNRKNPYPGTREFGADEQDNFFGRREEIGILSALVLARRTSLLFAQSGAGKSSLINAGLIPELTRREEVGRGPRRRIVQKMHVLPVAGVGGGIRLGLGRLPDNVFVFSALHSLFPEAEPRELVGQRLASGIAPLIEEAGSGNEVPILLIFDQFEELFTHHVERWHQRSAFFEQLTEALEAHPDLHLLISMREDFIAELTPFAGLLPGALRDRFRLERLRPEPALEAVGRPAKRAGLPFAAGVAEEMVDNLRRAQAGRQDAAGPISAGGEARHSEFVEPVHLQIVCQRLWQNLSDDQVSIETGDLQQFGDVDEALTDFYRETLDQILGQTEIREHRLRRWFEDSGLITTARTRGLVYRGAEATEGLPNAAVEKLVDAYLIRVTRRGNDTWYELAHDRLVEPIMADNRQWQIEHLEPLTVAAEAWKEADKDPRKLYAGELLVEARRDVEARSEDYSELELEFVGASVAEEEDIVRRRRLQLGITFGVISVLAIAAMAATWSWKQAVAANATAISRELAAHSVGQLEQDPELSLLLALEAVERDRTEEAGDALRRALLEPQVLREWTDKGKPLIAERFSPGGRLVATRNDGEIVVWGTVTGEELWRGPALRLTWSPDGQTMATGSTAGIEVWDTTTWQRRASGIETEAGASLLALGPGGELVAIRIGEDRVEVRKSVGGELVSGPVDHKKVEAAIFSADGKLLITSGLEVWNLWREPGTGSPIASRSGSDVVLDPSGAMLAVAGEEALGFWKLAKAPSEVEKIGEPPMAQGVKSAAFSSDGMLAVAGGLEGRVKIAKAGTSSVPVQWKAHQRQINSVAFDTAGHLVLTASQDRTAAVWTAGSGRLLARLRGHRQRVLDAAFTPESGLVLTASPRTARLWQLNLPRSPDIGGGGIQRAVLSPDGDRLVVVARRRLPGSTRKTLQATVWTTADLEEVFKLETGTDQVRAAAFSPDGGWVAIAASAKIHGFSLEGQPGRLLKGHEQAVRDLVFGPNGERLLSTGNDGNACLWDWTSERQLKCFPQASGTPAALSPGGDRVATNDGGIARIWTIGGEARRGFDPGKPIDLQDTDPAPDTSNVESVSFDFEGRRLVTASADGMMRVWGIDGELVSRRLLRGKVLYDAVFSPDGRSILAWGGGGTAYLWRLEDESPIIELSGHDRILGASFSSDGRLVLSRDGTRARAWPADSSSGRPLVELPLEQSVEQQSGVRTLSWSADGLGLAIAWRDRVELHACEVCRPLEELISVARERLRQRRPERRLEPAERLRYLHED